MEALARLATAYEAEGQLERALTFAWRQLELDPWWESAHRQAMRLLARSGQRDAALAQYQACCRLLAEELAAEPSAETVCLYEQIRDGQLPALRAQPARHPSSRSRPAPCPAFSPARQPAAAAAGLCRPRAGAGLAGRTPPGRPRRAWPGRVCRRRAGAGQDGAAAASSPGVPWTPTLTCLLAMGTCNAYSGVGDPYLPFRGVLAMLTGDAEAPWAAGILSTEQARRMWDALPDVAPVLARWGSGLVGTLLPGRELLGRARRRAAGRRLGPTGCPRWNAWPIRAPTRREGWSRATSSSSTPTCCSTCRRSIRCCSCSTTCSGPTWPRSACSSTWGGASSAAASCSPAPTGPTSWRWGGTGERHPLEPVLAEFRARFGDAWLDLAAADEAQGRAVRGPLPGHRAQCPGRAIPRGALRADARPPARSRSSCCGPCSSAATWCRTRRGAGPRGTGWSGVRCRRGPRRPSPSASTGCRRSCARSWRSPAWRGRSSPPRQWRWCRG